MARGDGASNRTIILAAVICGVAFTVLAFVYLSDKADSGPRIGSATVLVAARDLESGARVESADVQPIEIPDTFDRLIEQCITPDFLSTLEGMELNRAVPEGSPVLYSDLVRMVDIDLAPGKVALTVPVTGASALGGLLVPGDRVLVYVTRALPPPPDQPPPDGDSMEELLAAAITGSAVTGVEEWLTEKVVNGPLRVLAVGRHLAASRIQFSGAMSDEYEGAEYSSVTLEVSEDQVETILSASGAGQLPLTLVLFPAAGG